MILYKEVPLREKKLVVIPDFQWQAFIITEFLGMWSRNGQGSQNKDRPTSMEDGKSQGVVGYDI